MKKKKSSNQYIVKWVRFPGGRVAELTFNQYSFSYHIYSFGVVNIFDYLLVFNYCLCVNNSINV